MIQKLKITKAEQSLGTIKQLIAVAFQEFSQKGYAAASTEGIVKKAGVTRGALYHHFKDKKDLFLAVFKAAQEEIGRRIEQRVDASDDPWEQLTYGCCAFLEACTDPALQQVVVIDAPAVLDWNAYRGADQNLPEGGFSLLRQGLQELSQAGILKPMSIDALTHLLSGAMDEAAVWIAKSGGTDRSLEEAQAALMSLLDGLRK